MTLVAPLPADHPPDERRVIIPGIRAIAQHSWVTILTGKVIPLVLFLGLFESIGITPAVLAALAWSLGLVAYQKTQGHRIAGLVVLSIVGNTAKTIVAIATGSILAYFIQPTISTTLIGTAFLISIPLGFPLAERLIHDFCPLDDATANEPAFTGFFNKLSFLWAATSLLNGAVTLYLLLTQSITTFVVAKAFLGPISTGITLVIGIWWFRREMTKAGVQVVMARKIGELTAPIPTLIPIEVVANQRPRR